MSELGQKYVSINFGLFAEPAKDDKIDFKGKSSELCSFQFQMTETPPKCIIPLTNVTTAVGTPVVLQCLVNGKPHPTAEWYKDGDPVKDTRYMIQEKASGHFNLIITNVTQKDAGEYKCLIQNKSGYTETTALLKCVVTGSSPMTIVWHKDNIAVSSWGNFQIASDKTKYSLQIKNLQLIDQGTYICKLRVINKPSFVKTFETSVSSAIGNTLRLEGQVDEDTGVSITWIKDG
uniref:Ig-like domain-containing protein n=1 Tax=Oncorhynchus mykiss TaxID=8022 RepID=A0A8C7QXC1_ONCMY